MLVCAVCYVVFNTSTAVVSGTQSLRHIHFCILIRKS